MSKKPVLKKPGATNAAILDEIESAFREFHEAFKNSPNRNSPEVRELGRLALDLAAAELPLLDKCAKKHGSLGEIRQKLEYLEDYKRLTKQGPLAALGFGGLDYFVSIFCPGVGTKTPDPWREELKLWRDGADLPELCKCGLLHTDDFATIKWPKKDRTFHLTTNERWAFESIHDAYLRGTTDVALGTLYIQVDSHAYILRGADLFKTSGIWKAGLVGHGARRKTARLKP